MTPLAKAQVNAFVDQVVGDMHAAAEKHDGVIKLDEAPSWYSGLLGVAAGQRTVIAEDNLKGQLLSARDRLVSGPPKAGVLQSLGLSRPSPAAAAKQRKTERLADELMALMQLEGGAKYAQAVQAGISVGLGKGS